jgi:hypothetical protein
MPETHSKRVANPATKQASLRKQLFFEKKSQKTFLTLGHGRHRDHGPKESKLLCFFFFKKEVLPTYPTPPAT